MSPPCVAFFDGDNFGSTYLGVDRDEIRVVLYFDRGCPNYECAKDANSWDDLSSPGKPACPKTWPADNAAHNSCDYIWVRTARAFNNYFNERFQTYNRQVRYTAYVTSVTTPSGRRKDAVEIFEKKKPFAVIDFATYNGNNEAFDDAMAARGVLVFTQQTALPNEFFRDNERKAWGFWPDVEHWAAEYISYVCNRVVPFPVAHSGNPNGTGEYQGRERKIGLFYTTDGGEPGLQYFTRLVKAGIQKCGVPKDAPEGTFPQSGFLVSNSDGGVDQAETVARFKAAGVTTVLYLGGIEGKFTHEADGASYYPEIVIAGDLENDSNEVGRGQNPNVWQNAWAMHFGLRLDRPADTPAFQAYKTAYPQATEDEARFANEAYRDHFMLFQAIQVAGPRLNPESVDRGFHAIPQHQSTSPYIASCYFDPGDFTCVKDATEVWWDPAGRSPAAAQPGCMRLVDSGRRYLAPEWPRGDRVFADRTDVCNGYEGRFQINP